MNGAKAMLQHIHSNISKLLDIVESSQENEKEEEEEGMNNNNNNNINNNWATTPTAPRLHIASNKTIIAENKVKKERKRRKGKDKEEKEDKEDQDIEDSVIIINNNMEMKLKLLSVLIPIITNIVTMLTSILSKVIELKQRSLEPPQPQNEITKGKKRGREKKDVLADIDGTNIVIVTSKQLPRDIGSDCFVVNINSDFRKFSIKFPHMHIPIPFMQENRVGNTVLGIWQGLQVYEKEDVDVEYMLAGSSSSSNINNNNNTNNNNNNNSFSHFRIRKPTKSGKLLGWRNGLRGDKIMPLLEARKQILMVMYKHLIDTRLQKEYQMINKMKEEEGKKIVIVCEGQENGEREEDESNHFGSAGMLKLFLIR